MTLRLDETGPFTRKVQSDLVNRPDPFAGTIERE